MRHSTAGILACCVVAASAFRDTSPFLLFSSSPLPAALQKYAQAEQLQPASEVLQAAKDFLGICASDVYIIVSQPSLRAADLSSEGSIPNLRKAISSPTVQTSISISEVVGLDEGNVNELVDYIQSTCGDITLRDEDLYSAVGADIFGRSDVQRSKFAVRRKFNTLSNSAPGRADELANNDAQLYSTLLKHLIDGDFKYTVVYTTTPVEENVIGEYEYESQFAAPLRMELKRNMRVRKDDDVYIDPRPLFEKYQFLSPGLFMGLLATFLLLSILGVGISAISSLQVSYAAFDKEMGPAAQKKQQ